MRSINKRKLISLLAVMLLLFSTVGVAVAYFSAVDDAKGEAMLALTGKTEIHEGDDSKVKDVTIQNVGEADVFVRVKAFGPAQMVLTVDESVWVKGADDYYYYKGILAAGEDGAGETTASGTFKAELKVTDKEKAELGDEFSITVVQECSVVYDTADGSNSAGWTLPFSTSDL